MKRVVVSGIGMVSPYGVGVTHSWNRLLSGTGTIRAAYADQQQQNNNGGSMNVGNIGVLSTMLAARVPRGTDKSYTFNDAMVDQKYRSGCSDFIKYAIVATNEAMLDSKLQISGDIAERVGVCIGSGIGSLEDITSTYDKLLSTGNPNKTSAYFIPRILINEVSGIVAMMNNAKGPNMSIVSACATGTHAIGESFRKIKYGEADVMICGGTESSITPISLIGFNRMKSLSNINNIQKQQQQQQDKEGEVEDIIYGNSKPFDKSRDGFVMGEGAGILILEEMEHALARGAYIYAEIAGYGATCDAYHISSPDPNGDGAKRSMIQAINEANNVNNNNNIKNNNKIHRIDYINAHATSTPMGDTIELKAINNALVQTKMNSDNKKVMVSSNKGSIGHLLGAAGAVESIFSILSIRDNVIPHTLNLEEQDYTYSQKNGDGDENIEIDLIKRKAMVDVKVDTILKNSFGFGGTNSSILIKRFIK